MARAAFPDCYTYIRGYYRVAAYIGVRVRLRDGREGVIVPATHSQHYVHIQLDGDRKSDIYHPTDGLTYLVVGVPPSVDASDPHAADPGKPSQRAEHSSSVVKDS